ncbi:MAG: hypothetical protein A2Y07_00855 [Planctomycetes bacterium GWF2_50_10]|nr:MAG: hypothetical protein A2Y07_00855 [Planctomycetes bacterium GWF2_50_10]
MSKLLEIFGKALVVNVADLIWHWVDCVKDSSVQPKYRQDFDSAMDCLANMDLEAASQKLGFYLFENPDCVVGRMLAAAICLHKNCIREAIEQLNSVYVRQPSNTIALFALGSCYERLGLEEQAVEFYQDALKFKSHLELPRKRLSAIHLKHNRIDAVLNEYNSLVREIPEDIESLVMLGFIYLDLAKYADAQEAFNKAILAHPDNFHCESFDEIDQAIEAGEFDRAIEILTDDLAADSSRADLYVKLGDVYSMAGREVEALAQYEHALSLEPHCLQACVKVGTCNLRNENLVSASRHFARAMEINDEIIDAYVGLAHAQKMLGKNKECSSTLSLASAITPNTVLLFVQAAMAQFKIAYDPQLAQADALLESAVDPDAMRKALFKAQADHLAANPADADANFRFGLLLLSINDLAQAAKCFEQALSLNPHFNRARAKLAVCTWDMGKKTQAANIIAENVPLENDMLDMYYKTAVLYTDRNRFAAAARSIESNLNQSLNNQPTAPALANILQNLGLLERASVTLEYLAHSAAQN